LGGGGVSLIICDEPRYKNVNIPLTRISLNRKEIQRVVLISLMQKFLFRHIYIYLFIRTKRGIMKVKIYKGFADVHWLFVVAVIGDEER
jgi:hypothetical protein